MPKTKEREPLTYRWNDDKNRLEFWNTHGWRTSMYRDLNHPVVSGQPVVSYDESWCEPMEEYGW